MKGLTSLDQLRLRLAALAAGAGVFAMIAGLPAVARATVTPCPHYIYECGCTITSPGIYLIEDDLYPDYLTSLGDCIDISSPNVLLQTDPYSECELVPDPNLETEDRQCVIEGPGYCSGDGINIFSTATNVVVEDVQTSYWNVGIFDEGSRARIDEFYSSFNCQANVELSGVDASNVGFFETDISFYGVWLRATNDSQVIEGLIEENDSTGVYAGCSSSGPGVPCSKPVSSNRNYLAGLFVEYDDFGIAVDSGDSNNIVDDNVSFDSVVDNLWDGNLSPACDHNLWFDNLFSSANQSCIH
jgi:hypothetical protein